MRKKGGLKYIGLQTLKVVVVPGGVMPWPVELIEAPHTERDGTKTRVAWVLSLN